MKLTRRQMMLGGAAIGAVGLGAGAYAATATPADYFGAMLRAHLPGVAISDEVVHAFTADALVGRAGDFATKARVLGAGVRLGGYGAVDTVMHNNVGLQKFNREFLTRFLLNSNFFELEDPRAAAIVYNGPSQNCGNPFAVFEPPV